MAAVSVIIVLRGIVCGRLEFRFMSFGSRLRVGAKITLQSSMKFGVSVGFSTSVVRVIFYVALMSLC